MLLFKVFINSIDRVSKGSSEITRNLNFRNNIDSNEQDFAKESLGLLLKCSLSNR